MMDGGCLASSLLASNRPNSRMCAHIMNSSMCHIAQSGALCAYACGASYKVRAMRACVCACLCVCVCACVCACVRGPYSAAAQAVKVTSRSHSPPHHVTGRTQWLSRIDTTAVNATGRMSHKMSQKASPDQGPTYQNTEAQHTSNSNLDRTFFLTQNISVGQKQS